MPGCGISTGDLYLILYTFFILIFTISFYFDQENQNTTKALCKEQKTEGNIQNMLTLQSLVLKKRPRDPFYFLPFPKLSTTLISFKGGNTNSDIDYNLGNTNDTPKLSSWFPGQFLCGSKGKSCVC